MSTTSISLLRRLQETSEEEDWRRLVTVYEPFMRRILNQAGCEASEQDDLLQESMAAMVAELPKFQHNGNAGAFRKWLRHITVNRIRRVFADRKRAASSVDWLEQLEDPESDLGRLWDEEHDAHVLSQLMALVQPHFAPTSWEAFRMLTMEGCSAEEVAASLGMTANAALIAKSRILQRLRAEAEGLVDS